MSIAAIISWLGTAWSYAPVAWKAITGPVGRVVALFLIVGVWTLYQRHDAASDARQTAVAECQADKIAAEKAAVEQRLSQIERQLTTANAIITSTRTRADRADAEIDTLEKERDALVADLKTAADAPRCKLPDDVLRRLRAIQ